MTIDEIHVPLVPECSACIIDSLGLLIPLLSDDKEEQYNLYNLAYERIAKGYEKRETPIDLSINLYRELYRRSGKEDPYAEIKRRSNEAAKKVLPQIQRSIAKMDGYERLRGALAAAITGNVIDFNTAGHDPDLDALGIIFEDVLEEGFALDHSKNLYQSLISRKGELLYIADNAGEIILDIPLLRFIKDLDWNIKFAVKGKPLINDAVRADVIGTDVERYAKIIDTGAWAYGVPKNLVSKEFLEDAKRSDLIISKGQANIESFPEIQRRIGVETYYVTKGKCAHIVAAVGANLGDNIVLRKPTPDL
ncbi:MAG: damage-control phosphatase ARMT1 family protein [Candidatus Thorarchaeota archaeon]|jgi:uncharacterized protein with ATP-grasp and redox domains